MLCDTMCPFKSAILVVALVTANVAELSAQATVSPGAVLAGGLGVGHSGTPEFWRGGGGPIGMSGFLRAALAAGHADFGIELRQWLGRGDEVLRQGFPQPDAPTSPPVQRTVWLSRSDLMLIALLHPRATDLKVGVGFTTLQGIIRAQDCCLDAAGQWRETRQGAVLAVGMALPQRVGSRLSLVPAIDIAMHRVTGQVSTSAHLTLGVEWRRPAEAQ